MKWLILIALIPTASIADNIYIHTVSYHENRAANFNEVNYGVGFRYDTAHNKHIVVGTLVNSLGRQSHYIGSGSEIGKDLKIGLNIGFITGYIQDIAVPYVLPTIRYKSVSLTFIPVIEPMIHLTVDLF